MKVYNHPSYSYVKIVEVTKDELSLIDFAKCAEPRETLPSFYNRQIVKPDILINGGFFVMSTGIPCFNLIDDEIKRAYNTNYKWGIGTKKGNLTKFEYGSIDHSNWHDFICGYPVLLDGTGPIKKWGYANEVNYNALRSMIGYNKDCSKFFIVTVSKPGLKFPAMSALMYDIGCFVAVNLDGGGSSRLMVGGSVINVPTENRSVDNVACFYLKKSITNITPVNTKAYTSYSVIKGDTLSAIALKYFGETAKYTEIISFNNLTSTMLQIGQTLKIPCEYFYYTIKAGDSWWRIAAQQLGNGGKCTALAAYNGMTTSTSIHPGNVIKIPV